MSAIENVVNRMKRVMNMAAFVRGLMTRLTQRIGEMLRRNPPQHLYAHYGAWYGRLTPGNRHYSELPKGQLSAFLRRNDRSQRQLRVKTV
jgi:hypothetical protein